MFGINVDDHFGVDAVQAAGKQATGCIQLFNLCVHGWISRLFKMKVHISFEGPDYPPATNEDSKPTPVLH